MSITLLHSLFAGNNLCFFQGFLIVLMLQNGFQSPQLPMAYPPQQPKLLHHSLNVVPFSINLQREFATEICDE